MISLIEIMKEDPYIYIYIYINPNVVEGANSLLREKAKKASNEEME